MNRTERPEFNISGDGPSGYTGTTDRNSGEYRYKNGYTQRIYSDAHYVPVSESTVPPRYYTPTEHPVREPDSENKKPRRGAALRTVLACLACLVFGAAAGALYTGMRAESRFDELEARLLDAENSIESASDMSTRALDTADTLSMAAGLTPAEVYDIACAQVVGISTDVTYTNFFGHSTSSAVTGSGFIVTEDGYIITNFHVIEYAYRYHYDITVMLHDGTRYTAAIAGVEEASDLAVLKIDAAGLSPVNLGDSAALSVGDEVYAVGNPLGELDFSMTFGRVSALDRLITADENGTSINMFQFDAAVNSGNSGGPVYNQYGAVVGIVTAKYASSGVEGLGFAIPINDAATIAGDLITKGYVTGKAYLGVKFDQRFTSVYSRYYGLPNGGYVSFVEYGSCADTAGLEPGDIITSVGGVPVLSHNDVSNALRQFSAGDSTQLGVYRYGDDIMLDVVFDEAKPNRPGQ